jgi:hypothetical protein
MSERLMIQPLEMPAGLTAEDLAGEVSQALSVQVRLNEDDSITWTRGLRETAQDDLKRISDLFENVPDIVLNAVYDFDPAYTIDNR